MKPSLTPSPQPSGPAAPENFSSALRQFAGVLLLGAALGPAAGCSSDTVKGSSFEARTGKADLDQYGIGRSVIPAQFDTFYYAEKLQQIAAIREGLVYTVNPIDSTVTSPQGFKSVAPLTWDQYAFTHPHTKKLLGITVQGRETVFDVPIRTR